MATDRPAPRPCPRGNCCEHRIAIAAPVDRVWAILEDFAGWGAWNPLYPQAAGTLAPGSTIEMAVRLAGMKPQRAIATVTTFEPPVLLEYGTRKLGGLLRVHRYIELTPTGEAGCRVTNGQIMGGLAGKVFARFMGNKVREGLKGMNAALKARAEG